MPKRSAEEKLEHYNKKIRKLEEKVKKKHQRTIVYSDEDEIIQGETNVDIPNDEVLVLPPNNDSQSHETLTPDPALASSTDNTQLEQLTCEEITQPAPEVPGSSTEPTGFELNPELLIALGASTSDAPEFGAKIHETLTNLWSPLLKKGLPKEDKEKLLKEFAVPENCKFLQSPKLNAEISAAITDLARARDKKIANFQQQLGFGITAINRAMDLLLSKEDNKVGTLKYLSDGCRLLSDLHHNFTKDRTKLILPSLDTNFKHVIQDAERDETLFGTGLSEKIKASKAIERQGSQIKKSVQKSNFQSTGSRPTQQGNWVGPPRYPSNRGGRGGLRMKSTAPAPAAAPQRRQYYPNTAFNTKFAQSKTRAPTHNHH